MNLQRVICVVVLLASAIACSDEQAVVDRALARVQVLAAEAAAVAEGEAALARWLEIERLLDEVHRRQPTRLLAEAGVPTREAVHDRIAGLRRQLCLVRPDPVCIGDLVLQDRDAVTAIGDRGAHDLATALARAGALDAARTIAVAIRDPRWSALAAAALAEAEMKAGSIAELQQRVAAIADAAQRRRTAIEMALDRFHAGDLAGARDLIGATVTDSEGAPALLAMAFALRRAGDEAAALGLAEDAQRGVAASDRPYLLPLAHALRAALLVEAGDKARAEAAVHEAVRTLAAMPAGYVRAAPEIVALAELMGQIGRRGEARRLVDDFLAPPKRADLPTFFLVDLAALRAEWGDLDGALAVVPSLPANERWAALVRIGAGAARGGHPDAAQRVFAALEDGGTAATLFLVDVAAAWLEAADAERAAPLIERLPGAAQRSYVLLSAAERLGRRGEDAQRRILLAKALPLVGTLARPEQRLEAFREILEAMAARPDFR